MSKLLANQISNYNDNGPVEVKDGINVANGKPLQVAGAAGTSGQYLTSTGSSIAWSTLPTIPAAQVKSDWNASGTIAEILNKPTLATVATSGSYNDLLNKPTIPSGQIQSDWNQTNNTALDYILNKPTLFSGVYNDLSGKPNIPLNLNELNDVSNTAPNNNEVLKWNGSNWAPAVDSDAANTDTTYSISCVDGDNTDEEKIRLTAGGDGSGTDDIVLEAGTGLSIARSGDKITFTNTVTDTDTNTNDYVNSVSLSGNTLTLGRTGSQSLADLTVDLSSLGAGATVTTDDSAPGSPSDGDLWWKSDEGRLKVYYQDANSSQWVDASPQLTATSGGATVTTSDTAPSSPDDGDLWWKSDEGRLKVYYDDANSSQWVDASPPLSSSSSITTTTTNGTNSITTTTSTSGANANAIEIRTDNNTASAVRWRFTPPGHFIPFANAAYDIGNAEYKVRHMFLSDNTMYFEGDFLKVAQHNSGGSAQSPSYLIPLAKLKDALNASANYEAFKAAILAITDAS